MGCNLGGKHTNESAASAVEAPRKSLDEALRFYESFGTVRNVQCEKDADEVY